MKPFSFEKAYEEAQRIREMAGPDASGKKLTEASQHLDDVRAMQEAGWEPAKKLTREDIEAFEVTPEAWTQGLAYCDEHRIDLLEDAARAQPLAVSHRDPPFQVGCAVMGIGPHEPDDVGDEGYKVHRAYNFKPSPGPVAGKEKRCAERNALDMARRDCKVILGIALSSVEKSTGDPTKARDALHPCKDCRDYYRELLQEDFLREDTRIFCGNNANEQTYIEKGTIKDILELYSDDIP